MLGGGLVGLASQPCRQCRVVLGEVPPGRRRAREPGLRLPPCPAHLPPVRQQARPQAESHKHAAGPSGQLGVTMIKQRSPLRADDPVHGRQLGMDATGQLEGLGTGQSAMSRREPLCSSPA